jgi:adenylylsulfate kinase-like enzyme
MKLQTAQRKRAKIKLGLQGPSGSGKSFSALQIDTGLFLKWESVAVIDTENGSSELYSHLGPYQMLQSREYP